jgi:diguanylate cyclase (GGDEF)-like protein/PAS domain S-box-containing protein
MLNESRLELSAVLDTVVRRLSETLRDTAACLLLSDDGECLDFATVHITGGEVHAWEPSSVPRFPVEGSFLETVVRTGEPLFVPHLDEATRSRTWSEYTDPLVRARLDEYPIGSFLGVPLRVDDHILGVLIVARWVGGEPFVEDDLFVAQVMADRAAPFAVFARRDADLRASEERFRRLSEEAPDVIYRFRRVPTPGFEYVNGRIEALTGLRPEELYADPEVLRTLLHPDDHAVAMAMVADPTLIDHRPLVERWRRRDGSLLWIEHRMVPVVDDAGEIVAVEGIARDITDLKRAQDELAHRATHDHLTGLANRQLFTQELGSALARLDRRSGAVGVLFFDLDRFKFVNDSLGHRAGDDLLCAVADRLRAFLRPTDVPARLGGDEFGVLVTDADSPDAAVVVAERIQEALSEPFRILDQEVLATASIGIAHSERADESADDLLRHADSAMYLAKTSGGAHYEVFDEEFRATIRHRLELEVALRRALERDELRLHYQPIVDVVTRSVVAVEALLRWQRDGDLVEAEEFVVIAQETGLIVPLGEWVLRQAGADSHLFAAARGGRPLSIHVNVSARELSSAGFEEHVATHFGTDGGLCIEITESILLADHKASVAILRRLQARGVRLALDNFGTGHASLAGLRHLPLDALKIDRSLTEGLTSRGHEAAILGAVTSMARSLDVVAVAEGVATEEQFAALVELGCEQAQGYLLGRPRPAQDIVAALA